ncbi:MAG: nucleotidyltransferase domain-containing protein [bacterium]
MLDMLQEIKQKAVNEFKDFLLDNYSNRIELIELFGSKARGDGDKESDIDLLIVVDKEDRRFDDQICEMMTELSLEYNTLVSPVVFEKEEFELEKRVRTAIIRDIERDGILIWKAT